MEILEILWGITIGVLMGAITSLIGYAKHTKVEPFDNSKAFTTVAIGAVIGGIAAFNGWTYDQAYQYASTGGLTLFIQFICLAIYRRTNGQKQKTKKKKHEEKSEIRISKKKSAEKKIKEKKSSEEEKKSEEKIEEKKPEEKKSEEKIEEKKPEEKKPEEDDLEI